jgi:hypothetical protein
VSSAEKFVRLPEYGTWTDLVAAGLETSRACPCVFKMNEKKVYLLVYVDDILIIGKNDKEITEAKTILS